MTTKQTLPETTQFFAIETKGRSGVKEMVHYYQDQLWQCKPPYLPSSSKQIYFERAIMHISNQETLKPLMATREGLFQIYLALCKAVQLGMNVGGIRPHSYIVPRKKYKDGKWTGEYYAVFTPTQDGYRYVVTTGSTALFKDVLWGVVREGYTKFEIRESTGEIIYNSDPIKTANGNILGIWVKCVNINSNDIDIVKFVSIEKINSIRDRYSDSYKYAIKNKIKDGSPWLTDYEEQCIKTALKSVLKHYIGKCEGITMLDEIETQQAAEYNDKNIQDRVESRLDNVIESQNDNTEISADIITEKQFENNNPEQKEEITQPEEGHLF